MHSSSLPAFDARRVTDKKLLELVYTDRFRHLGWIDLIAAVKLLRSDNPTSVPVIKRLMSTGSITARKSVAKVLDRAFSHIREASIYSHEPAWKHRCEWVWHPSLVNDLTRVWEYGNLADELGGELDEDVVYSRVDAIISGMASSEVTPTVDAGSSAYWRGVTAMAISKVTHRVDRSMRHRAQVKARLSFNEDVAEFIDWAGNHPDLCLVINTAKARKTIKVSDLEAVIEQGSRNPPVAVGAL